MVGLYSSGAAFFEVLRRAELMNSSLCLEAGAGEPTESEIFRSTSAFFVAMSFALAPAFGFAVLALSCHRGTN